jgi:NAD(P)-dependent dehydrogenase (short-subunit alcohol dehydrogenase family)
MQSGRGGRPCRSNPGNRELNSAHGAFEIADFMTTTHHRVALVTGAGSGIGAATALRLAAEGAHVCCADLRADAAEATVRRALEAGHSASVHALDVREEAQWEAVIAHAVRAQGPLQVLVNCAGISAGSPLAETSLAEWQRVLSTNLDGAFLATKHGIRAMRERGGAIVHIGSASGIRPAAGAAAYSASKAGLGMLVRVAAKECRDAALPIRVCAVSPAGVKTPMWAAMPFFQDLIAQTGSEAAAFAAMEQGGAGTFAEAEDVARAVAFLASDAAQHINGVELVVDGGYVL